MNTDTTAVCEVAAPLPNDLLPGADWADAWQAKLVNSFDTPQAAARAMVKAFPKWTWPMLVVRQIVVFPFRLKGTSTAGDEQARHISFFPILEESDQQLVAGIDDRHLDFRLVVDLANEDAGQRITVTTLIMRHNWMGKTYLALVLPFHRAIIKSALGRIASDKPL